MPKCQATKLDGKPCQFNASKDYEELYCGHHKRQYHEYRASRRQTIQSFPQKHSIGHTPTQPHHIDPQSFTDGTTVEAYKRSMKIVLEWLHDTERPKGQEPPLEMT
jgi:hypothetical protein